MQGPLEESDPHFSGDCVFMQGDVTPALDDPSKLNSNSLRALLDTAARAGERTAVTPPSEATTPVAASAAPSTLEAPAREIENRVWVIPVSIAGGVAATLLLIAVAVAYVIYRNRNLRSAATSILHRKLMVRSCSDCCS
jgi:hypothetical protein